MYRKPHIPAEHGDRRGRGRGPRWYAAPLIAAAATSSSRRSRRRRVVVEPNVAEGRSIRSLLRGASDEPHSSSLRRLLLLPPAHGSGAAAAGAGAGAGRRGLPRVGGHPAAAASGGRRGGARSTHGPRSLESGRERHRGVIQGGRYRLPGPTAAQTQRVSKWPPTTSNHPPPPRRRRREGRCTRLLLLAWMDDVAAAAAVVTRRRP